jgi:hypothetical protein
MFAQIINRQIAACNKRISIPPPYTIPPQITRRAACRAMQWKRKDNYAP